MPRRRIVIAGVLCLAVLLAAALWWELRPLAAAAERRRITIPSGESTWQIGERLADAGLIRDPLAIALAARLRGAAGRLRAGEYLLSPSQSALEIVDVLARGESVVHRVTIPEGFTVQQVADALAEAGLVDRQRFLELALRGARRFARPTLEGLPVDSLEGYLFPDTYLLTPGLGEAAIIDVFLDRFDAALGANLRASARARGLTVHQLITIASMIEREARAPEERSVISGVIYNRLRRGMRLEIDATVLYALGRHKTDLTAADLQVDSPYNTYRREGLPPGPIANPGLAAIQAAAAPADVSYLYYVLKPDGRHQFSRTLAEHLKAVRRFRP